MNCLGRLTISVLVSAALALGTLAAWAQSTDKSANTEQGAQTSGQGQTGSEQSGSQTSGQGQTGTEQKGQTAGQGQTGMEHGKHTAGKGAEAGQAGKQATLTGCLGGPNEQGEYTLTSGRSKKEVEVDAGEGIDLKSHVGHTVKLTGNWEKSGAAAGEKEKTGAAAGEKEKTQKGERHFKATNVTHVSEGCTGTTGAKAKGKTS